MEEAAEVEADTPDDTAEPPAIIVPFEDMDDHEVAAYEEMYNL